MNRPQMLIVAASLALIQSAYAAPAALPASNPLAAPSTLPIE
jgi:hypothetical protein